MSCQNSRKVMSGDCFTDTSLDGTGEENGEAAITEYRLHPRSAAVFVGIRWNR